MAFADWPAYDDFEVLSQATNEAPEVSVIVPSYNMEDGCLLERCLDSLRHQTERSLEVIVVDDCSTDNSLAIAVEAAAEADNITVLAMRRNRRQGGARNRGLSVARGSYVGFVDADDTVEPWYYERMLAKAKRHRADVVAAPFRRVDMDGTALSGPQMPTPRACAGDVSPEVFSQLILHHNSFWSQLWRADGSGAITKAFPEDMLYEDTPTLLRWLAGVRRIVLLDGDAGYNYRDNPSSTVNTTALSGRALEDRLRSGEMVLSDAKDLGLYERHQDEYDWYFLQVYLMNTCKAMARAGNRDVAFFASAADRARELVPDWRENRYYSAWSAPKRALFSLLMSHPKAAYRFLRAVWALRHKVGGMHRG